MNKVIYCYHGYDVLYIKNIFTSCVWLESVALVIVLIFAA